MPHLINRSHDLDTSSDEDNTNIYHKIPQLIHISYDIDTINKEGGNTDHEIISTHHRNAITHT